jgi:metal transporter CNNM
MGTVTGFQWLDIVLALGLIVASAVFSGLTLGYLSLELSALTVIAEAGAEPERGYAKKIIPLRKNGNLLLCTLVIGNVVVNSFLSILMADMTSGPKGLLISTVLIVVFGEITPQAICSRHALVIGAWFSYFTWVCVVSFFVIAWPVSKFLDFLLGSEVGTVYTRDELKHLIKLQVNKGDYPSGDGIHADEHINKLFLLLGLFVQVLWSTAPSKYRMS